MVDFIRNDENNISFKKYIYNFPIFKNISDQSNIKSFVSEGWKTENEPKDAIKSGKSKKSFRYYFSVDEKNIFTIKNIFIHISYADKKETYNFLNNPDNVRLSFETAQALKYEYPKNEDGTPDEKNMPSFYVAKFMFDEIPLDSIFYKIEIIGENDEVLLFEEGTMNVIDEIK